MMHNPFSDQSTSDTSDEELAQRAAEGSKSALEELVKRHQGWIYSIAQRMLWHPQDAEEATQEVLIKVCTRLHSFRRESQFRTWLYRIVTNHVLNMKRGRIEPESLTFVQYGDALDCAPDRDLPDPKSVPVDVPLLVEEAKIGCLAGMLLCLDRRQRVVFVLGELLGATDQIGAEILETSPANFRQLLSRSRRDLYQFMNEKCGLINAANPCRCHKKTRAFMEAGYVDPENLHFVSSKCGKWHRAASVSSKSTSTGGTPSCSVSSRFWIHPTSHARSRAYSKILWCAQRSSWMGERRMG